MNKSLLINLYINKGFSVSKIAAHLNVSENKINYWIKKFNIPKRTISDAMYLKKNPNGDPFRFTVPKNEFQWFLFGLGMGIYWGEGNKKNTSTVRMGNTDPKLVLNFIKFLEEVFQVDRTKLKFGLQLFSDTAPTTALNFWKNELRVDRKQFQSVVVSPARAKGTYKEKNIYGVVTVYFYNTKLQKILKNIIENLNFV